MHQSLVGSLVELLEKRYVFSVLIQKLVKGISKKSYIQRMGKFKRNAKEWRHIRIQHEESSHSSTRVFDKIVPSDEAFGIVHNSCS